ncbi:hypothetical protein EZV62_012234 [Acer yangbiense]|uniref:Zinc knuckle CX2CX4HX4C domain-containing protein n=1 Tax=Acer yangbiense TaxID=1000413 RepID=A0A5C7HUU2_9ROSI|nr:hypothetical protein EZV62_012234 [Acer yangbiense]
MEIESIIGNTFSFHFQDRCDLDRVIAGSPWSFDNALIAMVIPSGQGTIDSLEVRVDITKSLERCLRVDVLGDGIETTMILRYERLPNHCFKCGMVNHFTSECADEDPVPLVNGKAEFPFGIWLRASGLNKGSFNYKPREVSFYPVQSESNWRQDRGKTTIELDSLVEKGKEGVMCDESILISGSLDTQVEVPAAADVMAVEGGVITAVSSAPRPVVLVEQQQSAMVDSLVHRENDMGSINCKIVMSESCAPSKATGGGTSSGLSSKAHVVSPSEDSGMAKAHLGEVLVGLNPVIPSGPFVEVDKSGPAFELHGVAQQLDRVNPGLVSQPLLASELMDLTAVKKSKYKRIGNSRVVSSSSDVVCGKRKAVLAEEKGLSGGRKARKIEDYRVAIGNGPRGEGLSDDGSSAEVTSLGVSSAEVPHE